MQRVSNALGIGTVLLAVILVVGSVPATADTWLSLDAGGSATLQAVPGAPPAILVERSDLTGFAMQVETSGVGLRELDNEAGRFIAADWGNLSSTGEVGTPALPVVRRLFIAPAGAIVSYETMLGEPVVIELSALGLPARLAAVQPPIEKLPGAAEAAGYAFDAAAYAVDADVPGEVVTVEELGLVRGQRLCLLEIRPVAHNPVAGTLTLYPQMGVRIAFDGAYVPRDAMAPLPGLADRVLNPEVLPVAAGRVNNNYLIIVAPAYETGIQPFAAAKNAHGFNVSTWVATSASNTAIKSYIQGLWGTQSAPDYILLVGDTDTIPHWTGGGAGSPATDLPYACMDGSSDWYPDIALGRFPVRNTGQLQAIIDKTLLYQNGPLPDPDYMDRAVFMASSDNYTVSEGTHNWVISNYMDPNGITSDKLYCHTYSATTQQVRNAFNAGRFWGIYSGHGSNTSWADGPQFTQSDVNNLTNTGMYPVVHSFACITGTYTLDECFMETWIRAAGKGSIVAIGSSVNSYWTEDDVLEKRLFDSIFDTNDNVPARVGPVWNDTRTRYLTEMGSGSTTRRYFEMYNIMGDPALQYFGPEVPPRTMIVAPEDELYAEGPVGGPFPPPLSLEYTVTNTAAFPINYAVDPMTAWVTAVNGSGQIPAHGAVVVTLLINDNAAGLPAGRHLDEVEFVNLTNSDGNTRRTVTLKVGTPVPLMAWPLDTDPGWTRNGQWDFGQPTGQGGRYGYPDPTAGATGVNVLGVNLDGNYPVALDGAHWVTLGPLDLTDISETSIRYQRWLNSDHQPWVSAMVEVSSDGTTWTRVWENGDETITDNAWTQQSHEIWELADHQPAVWVRWGYRVHRWDALPYSGWNIDDIELWGLVPAPPPMGACCYPDGSCLVKTQATCSGAYVGDGAACDPNPCLPPVCAGDADCDGVINWRDIDYFVAAMNDNVAAWEAMFAPGAPACPFANNDVDGSGTVNWRDIDPLVALMNTTCP